MTDFKKGDVVQLKSGGPKMTIQNLGDYGPLGPEEGAACVWFEGTKPKEGIYDIAVLETASKPSLGVSSVRR